MKVIINNNLSHHRHPQGSPKVNPQYLENSITLVIGAKNKHLIPLEPLSYLWYNNFIVELQGNRGITTGCFLGNLWRV